MKIGPPPGAYRTIIFFFLLFTKAPELFTHTELSLANIVLSADIPGKFLPTMEFH